MHLAGAQGPAVIGTLLLVGELARERRQAGASPGRAFRQDAKAASRPLASSPKSETAAKRSA